MFVFLFLQGANAMEITLDWKFINPTTGKVVWLGEKGSVQEALIADGTLPDPFYGENEKLFDWIENYEWVFTSEFTLNQAFFEAEFIDLELPNVDTYAKIYLNDSLILTTSNSFRPYYKEIKSLLKLGINQLRIVFTPPTMFHKEDYLAAKYKLPAPNDNNPIAIAPYTRKPQYQFGWDWALRMVTIGLNKPVKIIGFNTNRILGKNIQTIDLNEVEAKLKLQWIFRFDVQPSYYWKSGQFDTIQFKQLENILEAEVKVVNPVLWWPVGYGNPNLYRDNWILVDVNGNEVCKLGLDYGIRKTELLQEKDEWGTSYVVRINNQSIFCKGGDYIPQDIFPARVSDSSIINLIEQLKQSNFNMIRVWGGGYYPDEVFFNTCDKEGIMVWQDFMFACSMYPGDDDFLENVKEEFNYQVPRISSHPSVVLFNGNNEVDVAWKNWGFQLKYGLYGKSAREIERSYDDLFKKLLPSVVTSFSSVPYVHTSPLSNWGKDEFFNHGTQHYWGVWHGSDPIEDFGKKIGRFNAEYGFQSFPEYKTLSTFSTQLDWDLNSPVMKHHQKSYVGNGMIKKHADNLYGSSSDFEEFVYYSQLTQAKAVGIAIAGHRLDWPRCTGTIYWQINDCWPAPSWSSMDYYGNWKALQYQVKKDFVEQGVIARESKIGVQDYFFINDKLDSTAIEIVVDVYSIEGIWQEGHVFILNVGPQSHKQIPLSQVMQGSMTEYIVRINWKEGVRTFSFKQTNNEVKSTAPILDLIDAQWIDGAHVSTFKLSTDLPLVDCFVYSDLADFFVLDNFETLLNGDSITIQSKSPIDPTNVKLKFR